MAIHLESVQFNNSTTATRSALNLRIDATTAIVLPEWKRGRSDQYSAAYTADVINQTPEILAEFSCDDPTVTNTRIRAVLPTGLGGNLLGAIQPMNVTFSAGTSGKQTLNLATSSANAVGIHTINWHWQFRLKDEDDWADFDTSHHQIYVLLDLPNRPWSQDSSRAKQWPWTRVLDQACVWAQAATSLDDVASLITKEFNESGLKYDSVLGNPYYSNSVSFFCTNFISWLQGGTESDVVNCTDCACIVSTFANILGCELFQSYMGNSFEVKNIIPIGGTAWQSPFPGKSKFAFHEVAWKPDCKTDDRLFDSCLQVNAELVSANPPIAELPLNTLFGGEGDGDYRDKLTVPGASGSHRCNPSKVKVARTPVDTVNVAGGKVEDPSSSSADEQDAAEKLEMLKLTYKFDEWNGTNLLDRNLFVSKISIDIALTDHWKKESFSSLPADTEDLICLRSIWSSKDSRGKPNPLLYIEIYECHSRAQAHELLLSRLGMSQFPDIPMIPAGELGDVAFGDSRGYSRIFARANLVLVLSNATASPTDIRNEASLLDRLIIERPEPTHTDNDPKIDVFRISQKQPRVDEPLLIEFDVSNPSRESMWYKFFSDPGEVSDLQQRLVYQSNVLGQQNLTAYAITESRSVAKRDHTFNISQ